MGLRLDSATVRPGASLIRANDQNLDDAPIAVSLASNPGNGSAFVLADNRISYIAESDFVGIDSFIYSVVDADGNNSNAVVRITVVAQYTGGTGTNQNNPAPPAAGPSDQWH